jgi:hypothetical protein
MQDGLIILNHIRAGHYVSVSIGSTSPTVLAAQTGRNFPVM